MSTLYGIDDLGMDFYIIVDDFFDDMFNIFETCQIRRHVNGLPEDKQQLFKNLRFQFSIILIFFTLARSPADPAYTLRQCLLLYQTRSRGANLSFLLYRGIGPKGPKKETQGYPIGT